VQSFIALAGTGSAGGGGSGPSRGVLAGEGKRQQM